MNTPVRELVDGSVHIWSAAPGGGAVGGMGGLGDAGSDHDRDDRRDHFAVDAACWAGHAPGYAARARALWTAPEPSWGCGRSRSPCCRCCPTTSRGSTPSSSGAAPRPCRRGWRDAERLPFPDARPTWRSASTGRPCGATRTAGSPRPRACCGRAVAWSSCATRRCSCGASRRRDGRRTASAVPARHRADGVARPGRDPGRRPPAAGRDDPAPAVARAGGRRPRRRAGPPEGATTTFPFVTTGWARRWPTEEVWFAHRQRADGEQTVSRAGAARR